MIYLNLLLGLQASYYNATCFVFHLLQENYIVHIIVLDMKI